ncbi:MAG: hypothetical protein FJW40_09380 [Acidobacteria bacterium]|nr:hypothetical protein [Acidobacteriota bacterium]
MDQQAGRHQPNRQRGTSVNSHAGCLKVVDTRRAAKEPKLLLAGALDAIGEKTFNAPSRNYTMAYAARLRRQVEGRQ